MAAERRDADLALQPFEGMDLDQAIVHFQEVVARNPGHSGALFLLGKALARKGRPEARQILERTVQVEPGLTAAHLELALLLEEQQAWHDAAAALRRFLQLRPDHADACNRLGIALARLFRFEEAVAQFQRVLELEPGRAGAHHNIGVALADQDRPADALAHFDEAIRHNPHHAEAHKGKGMALLKLGQFGPGWVEYEWRWRCADMVPLASTQPAWDGSDLDGKCILLIAEQGIGDVLQFVRFAAQVKMRGASKVILACARSLFHLLGTCPGVDLLTDANAPLPAFDVHAPLLSLPRLLGTDVATIPAAVPYVRADSGKMKRWRRELADQQAFKIGIVWQGNPKNPNDHNRSIPLAEFEPLTRVPGVRLFSLQKGPGLDQLTSAVGQWVVNLSHQLDGSFVEAAALMPNLDLVVCCDTAMAHLAGALAVPVWVAIHRANDWRWLQHRQDTPWYPSMRLFRQERGHDWAGVFRKMAQALANQVGVPGKNRLRKELQQPLAEVNDSAHRDAESWLERGLAQQANNQLAEAAESIRRVLQSQPDHADAHANLGMVLGRQGQPQAAESHLRQAVRLRPGHARAYYNLGVALTALGKKGEALGCFQEAVRLDANYVEARFNLAVSLAEHQRPEEAGAEYEQLLRLRPEHAEVYSNLGLLRMDQGRPSEGVILLQQAVRLKPDYADAHNNLALALLDVGRPDESLPHFDAALRSRPLDADTHNNLGTALATLGRLDESLACYDQVLRLKPGYPEAHWHQALAWLHKGDLARGWPAYEWRWKRRRSRPRPFDRPLWDGSSLDGKTILLWCEQGQGDALQFIRYAPLVKERGGRVIVECSAKLLALFATCEGVDQLIEERTELPPFDEQVPLMSLPGIFNTTLSTIPAAAAYLSAEPTKVENWRRRFGTEATGAGTFKIGIVWQGNPKHRWDRQRSFPVEHFQALSRVDGVQLFGLQKGPDPEVLADAARRIGFIDLSPGLNDFADTAVAMQALDLVITCDSAPAHLAGALGVPVWVGLSTITDWRWLTRRDDSPWYPSMRLFRQKRVGDWDEVFQRIERELVGRVSRPVRTALESRPT